MSCKYLYILLCCSFVSHMFAQQDTSSFLKDSTKLVIDEVEVVKAFKANIVDSKPIYAVPFEQEKEKYSPLQLDYKIQKIPFEIEYPDPIIKPLAYTEEKIREIYDGYLDVGYGNYESPYGEGQIQYYIEDWFEAGIAVYHHSAQDSSSVARDFSRSKVAANAAFYLTDITKTGLDVVWSKDVRSLLNNDIDIESLDYDVDFNDFYASINIDHNAFSVGGFSSNSSLYFDRFKIGDPRISRELTYGLKSHNKKTINSNFTFELPFDVQYFKTKVDSSYANTFFDVNPHINYTSDNINVKAGVYFSSIGENYIFPSLFINYIPTNKNLAPFIQIKPKSIRNSYRNLTEINYYFVNPSLSKTIAPTRNETEMALGVQYFKLKNRVTVKGFYTLHENYPVFSNAADPLVYEVQFENFNALGFNVAGNYALSEIFGVNLHATVQDLIGQNDSPDPYFISTLDLRLGLTQTLWNDKLELKQELAYLSGRRLADISNRSFLSPVTDISLSIKCYPADNIGFFIRADNLLDQHYQLYEQYSNLGRQFHGGLSIKF